MGLLCTDQGQDRHLAYEICESLIQIWDRKLRDHWGYTIEIDSIGIDRSCLLADEHLFKGHTLPVSPGPFKRAAAFSIFFRQQVEVDFIPFDGNDPMKGEQVIAWKARLALLAIPLVLQMCEVKGQKLDKEWKPATDHLRCEILTWLRWLETPTIFDSSGKKSIDLARLCRSILAFAMIVEQSYYIVGATINCNIMGMCGPEVDHDDEIVGPDVWFLREGMMDAG